MKMEIEDIAEVCHEVNRNYCASLGDNSQPEWANAPDWAVESAISGVKFHIANPDAGPEHSHEEWLKGKTEDGWVYGKIKDAEKKEHPCFVAYEHLPADQQAKDYIFQGVVHVLAKKGGFLSV